MLWTLGKGRSRVEAKPVNKGNFDGITGEVTVNCRVYGLRSTMMLPIEQQASEKSSALYEKRVK